MKSKNQNQLTVLLLLLLASSHQLNAAITVFSASTNNFSPTFQYLSINGDLVESLEVNSSASLTAEIDDVNSTFKIKELNVSTSSTSQLYTKSVTVGLGQTKDFDIELTVRPFSFQSSNLVESPLTPESGGFFSVDTTGILYPFSLSSIVFDYTITGPTESLSGTSADLPVSEFLVNYFGTTTTVDTNNYPSTIVLGDLFYSLRYGADFTIFEESVDGVNLDMDVVLGGNQLFGRDSDIEFTAVPEPSKAALLLGVFGIACACAKRRLSTR